MQSSSPKPGSEATAAVPATGWWPRASTARADRYAFLPAAIEVLETPPHPAARVLAGVLISLLVIALAWSILGRIDQVAVASGQIVPVSRVQIVQPIESGVIRQIHVRDGQHVKAGDPLIELDPTETDASIAAQRAELAKAKIDAAIADALLATDPAAAFEAPDGVPPLLIEAARLQVAGETERLAATLAGIDAEIAEQQGMLEAYGRTIEKTRQLAPIIADRLAGLEELEAKGLVRKPDILAVRQQKIENETEASTTGAAEVQARARIESRLKRRAEAIAAARTDALQRKADALRRIVAAEQQIRRDTQRREDRILRAPVSGVVTGQSAFTIGGVVTTKDVIMRVVPEGAILEAEVMVLNRDIGFVAVGQPVELKLETFPFTRFGLIEGRVKQVWRDAIQDEKQGLVYKAEVTLAADKILIGRDWVPLAPGMAVQAEIKTGDRRVISYFLSPLLRYRDESLRER